MTLEDSILGMRLRWKFSVRARQRFSPKMRHLLGHRLPTVGSDQRRKGECSQPFRAARSSFSTGSTGHPIPSPGASRGREAVATEAANPTERVSLFGKALANPEALPRDRRARGAGGSRCPLAEIEAPERGCSCKGTGKALRIRQLLATQERRFLSEPDSGTHALLPVTRR